MTKPQVFLIGDTSNRLNWGCRATTYALKSLITETSEISSTLDFSDLLRSFHESNQDSSSKNFFKSFVRKTGRKLREVSNIRPKKEPDSSQYPVSIKDFDLFADRFQRGTFLPSIQETMKRSDIVVINGEGGFLKSERCFPALMSLFLGYLAKEKLNKPCIITNHTADIRHPDVKEIAQRVYPLFDDVVVREPFSLRAIEYLRENKPLILAADAVFKYRPATSNDWIEVVSRSNYFSFYPFNAQELDVRNPYICVGGSAGLHPRRRKDHDPFPGFLKLCKALNDIHPVVLVAACGGDEDFMQEVSKELSLPVLGTAMPTHQAVDVLGNAALYVGGRWHSCIKAVTGGTPIVVLSSNTNYKAEGIIELMELDHEPFDSFRINELAEDIVSQSIDYLNQGLTLRKRLFARAQELSVSAEKNVRYLAG